MYRLLLIAALFAMLSACKGTNPTIDTSTETYHPQTNEDRRENNMDSFLTKSEDPLVLYSSKKGLIGTSGSGSGGNALATGPLWRAALESISFMPLASVDSNGGVILTDWYSSAKSPNERLKFNIIILSPELQITSLKVTAFKEVHRGGAWHSAEVTKELSRTIEDNILRKAIALKAAGNKG